MAGGWIFASFEIPVNGILSGVNIAAEAHACPGPRGYCQQRMRDKKTTKKNHQKKKKPSKRVAEDVRKAKLFLKLLALKLVLLKTQLIVVSVRSLLLKPVKPLWVTTLSSVTVCVVVGCIAVVLVSLYLTMPLSQ